MVGDENSRAFNRLDGNYNFAGYPTVFFDGGYRVMVGDYGSATPYRNMITTCGQRTTPPLDLITNMTWMGDGTVEVQVKLGNAIPANHAPTSPVITSGSSFCIRDAACGFETGCIDSDGDLLYYQWDWGDGEISDWIGPFPSGEICTVSHAWTESGVFDIRVSAKDIWGYTTEWSPPVSVGIDCCVDFAGNVDNDPEDLTDLGDLTKLIDYLFISFTPPICLEEANIDGDPVGTIDLGDLTRLIDYLFISFILPADCQ